MAAAGGGDEDASQVLRTDTDCPGNGQCESHSTEGRDSDRPQTQSQKTPVGREGAGMFQRGHNAPLLCLV